MIGICREHAKNVKRWRDGQMAMRWCAPGMVEASGQFRRVNGHLHLPTLRAALERHVTTETVAADCNTQDVNAVCQGPVGTAQGRSWDLPGDGHENGPVAAMGSAQDWPPSVSVFSSRGSPLGRPMLG